VRKSKSVRHLFAVLTIGVLAGGIVGCDDESDKATESEEQPPAAVVDGPAAPRAPVPAPSPEEARERTVAGHPKADVEDQADEDAEPAEPSSAIRRGKTQRRRTTAKRRSAKAHPASGRARAQSGPSAHSPEPGIPALSVRRLVVSRGIVNREPTGVMEHVTLGKAERVFAFVELQNPAKSSSQVNVRFVSPAGQPIDVLLEVGDQPRWRTWAFTRKVRETGTWTVTVRTTDGAELARTQFEVTQ